MTSWIFCLADSSYYKLPFSIQLTYFLVPILKKSKQNTFRIPSTNFNIRLHSVQS